MKSEHVTYLKYAGAGKDEPAGYRSYPGIALTEPDGEGRIQIMFLHPERHKNLSGADWRDAVDRAIDVLPEGQQAEGVAFYRILSGPPETETKEYSDGSSATGPGPLPDESPAQQDATNGKPVLVNGKKARPVASGK